MQNIINELQRYINQTRTLWYALWISKGPMPYSDDAIEITDTLSKADPSSSITFKYVIDLLYYNKLFKTDEQLRLALLDYIKSYVPIDEYSKMDIAKHLELFAPKKHGAWWSLGLIQTSMLTPPEQSIIQNFREEDFSHKLNMRRLLTDKKIVKIADDVKILSNEVYKEIPVIDKRIKTEILRISDDLYGLTKLTTIINQQFPFILKQIQSEIVEVVQDLTEVINRADRDPNDFSPEDFDPDGDDNGGGSNYSYGITKSEPELTSESEYSSTTDYNSTSDEQNDFDHKNSLGYVDNSTLPSYAPLLDHGVHTDSDYTGCHGQAAARRRLGATNQHSTEALSDKSLEGCIDKLTENDTNEQQIHAEALEDYLPGIESESIDNNLSNNLSGINDNSDNTATHSFNITTSTQKDYSKDDTQEIKNIQDTYEIVIYDPKNNYNDNKIILDIKQKLIIIDSKTFDISSDTAIMDFKDYLEHGRTNLSEVKFNDIIQQFKNETILDEQQLNNIGLKADYMAQ